MATKNLYHRRLVAESSSKACWICFKPTSTVLITVEQDDWFHICPGHLKDRKFAIPKDEEDLAEKKRKEDLEKEIALVKKEFDDKVARKLEKRKKKDDEKEGKKKEDAKDAEKKQDDSDEKEKDEKLKELEKKKEPEKAAIEGPRVFELQKNFWQMRLQKKRDAEAARKNRERLKNPATFPSAPTGSLGG